MGRTWSTFNTPPQWGKIQGIPSDFSDGKIDWNEIQNKPSTFPHSGLFNSDIFVNKTSANLYLQSQLGQYSALYFQYPSGYSWAIATINKQLVFVSFLNGNPLVTNFSINAETGNIQFLFVPSSGNGLPSGSVWRDTNGFLRMV